jgi:NADH dehydrogenase
LIETADRVLTTFPASLSRKAARALASLGVTLLLERTVVDIDEEAVFVAAPDGSTECIPARTAIWAAGVKASTLAAQLGVAMHQGRHAAKLVRSRLSSHPVGPFRYVDKGNLATIGRARAVADLHAIQLSGFLAWAAWLVVHLFYLIGFQNRLIVLIRWFISFVTRGRGARLITSTRATESAPRPEALGVPTPELTRPAQAPSDDREVLGQ